MTHFKLFHNRQNHWQTGCAKPQLKITA